MPCLIHGGRWCTTIFYSGCGCFVPTVYHPVGGLSPSFTDQIQREILKAHKQAQRLDKNSRGRVWISISLYNFSSTVIANLVSSGIPNQKDPRGSKLSCICLSRGKVDVIVTDPDDGSDCRSLNRKIPARVGHNKSQTGTWNSAKSAKAGTVTAGGLVKGRVWISIVSVPKRPTDTHVHTQNCLCKNIYARTHTHT